MGVAILPGLAVGLFVSSFLVAWWPVRYMEHWPRTNIIWGVILMSAVGVVSPFCSYLAIPIGAALILSGVPTAPVVAFLCATPLMNPTLFGMTWSLVGWPMAVARAASAFGFGIFGGALAVYFSNFVPSSLSIRSSEALSVLRSGGADGPFFQHWWKTFRHLGFFAVKYVALGIALAAVVKEVIPMEWVESVVGRKYGHGILCGALLGVPLYACGGGTIPLVQILMNMGMSPGAALAFFVAGPATKLPILVTMKATAGTPLTVAYLVLNLVWAVLSGALFQVFC